MISRPKGWMLVILFLPLFSLLVISYVSYNYASAQQESGAEAVVLRRVEIWGLFYRLMVAAFVVGAVVQGSIVYVCWRFSESNPKNRIREPLEGAR
jgi:heme/copper-type cytochrome/quinol oxidase subunit 2